MTVPNQIFAYFPMLASSTENMPMPVPDIHTGEVNFVTYFDDTIQICYM